MKCLSRKEVEELHRQPFSVNMTLQEAMAKVRAAKSVGLLAAYPLCSIVLAEQCERLQAEIDMLNQEIKKCAKSR